MPAVIFKAASHNVMKARYRYAVQGSDTTMIPRAASLPGQKGGISNKP